MDEVELKRQRIVVMQKIVEGWELLLALMDGQKPFGEDKVWQKERGKIERRLAEDRALLKAVKRDELR